MIYPLMPLFLTRVLGAGAMSLGVIEGVAEAANSVLKIWSGRLADRTGAPKRLVIAGYGLSSAMRPFIGAATSWMQVLALRFIDRLGKGIRGAPRDAMLAVFATSENRGRVFGFHRAMDHAGAVVGPLAASAFLFFYPDAYRTLFTLTIIPGIIVMLILFRVPEAAPRSAAAPNSSASLAHGGRTTAANWLRTNPPRVCQAICTARSRLFSSSVSATPATRSCSCEWETSALPRSGFRFSGRRFTS